MRESTQRARPVHNKSLHRIFSTVYQRYDLVNHVLTWGLDGRWRHAAAKECLNLDLERVLDLCCGTGDLAIHLARLADGDTDVVGVDFSSAMLEVAACKAERLANCRKISFIHGDAAYLPFPDEYFDCIGISFAFRNLTFRNQLAPCYLAEILRVLHTGGRFVILESSQPKVRLIRRLFHLYLRFFAYRTGYILSGNKSAYRYLVESATRFYTPEEIQRLLITTGFTHVIFRPLFLGAAAIHVAVK